MPRPGRQGPGPPARRRSQARACDSNSTPMDPEERPASKAQVSGWVMGRAAGSPARSEPWRPQVRVTQPGSLATDNRAGPPDRRAAVTVLFTWVKFCH